MNEISSSYIKLPNIGITGSTGNIGPSGPIGNTGNIGETPTCITGSNGYYLSNTSNSTGGITFTFILSSFSSCDRIWIGPGCPDFTGNGYVDSADFLALTVQVAQGSDVSGMVYDLSGNGNVGSALTTFHSFGYGCVSCPNWWKGSTLEKNVGGAEVFRGNILVGTSGENQGITAINIGTVSLLQGLSFTGSGMTNQAIFNFKNIISGSSGISITSDSNFIYINATGGTFSINSHPNGLVYYNTPTTIISTNPNISGIGFTSDVYYGITKTYLHLNGISGSTNSIRVFTKKFTVPNTLVGQNYLDLSLGGIFDIKTPYGFHGFTGIVGASGSTGTILSATLIIENDNIWNFPQNIFFRSGEAYLSCGTSVIGVYSTNNGATWNADFFGRGYGVDSGKSPCFPAKIKGSYNYQSLANASYECVDYITQKESTFISANLSYTKTFCPLQVCSSEQGYCCIKGKCQTVPKHLCLKYGGRFHGKTPCSDSEFCWNPCTGVTGSCKINEICTDRYTEKECISVGGVYTNTYCNTPLPLIAEPMGACCNITLEPNCEYISKTDCMNRNGVFTLNTSCENINCGTVTDLNSYEYAPLITESTFTKNIKINLGNGKFDCITIMGTISYLSQFQEC